MTSSAAALNGAEARDCPECGQRWRGASCRECFDALLAYENERPAVFGAVHHLTVATYHLQHPAGYTREALASWHELISNSMDDAVPTSKLLTRMRERFDGARRVRLRGDEDAAHLQHWPREWPMTVGQVVNPAEPLPDEAEYVTCALEWAAATRAILDARQPLS